MASSGEQPLHACSCHLQHADDIVDFGKAISKYESAVRQDRSEGKRKKGGGGKPAAAAAGGSKGGKGGKPAGKPAGKKGGKKR